LNDILYKETIIPRAHAPALKKYNIKGRYSNNSNFKGIIIVSPLFEE